MTEDFVSSHMTSCCARHGCAWANRACPVANGEALQRHWCALCKLDWQRAIDDLHEFWAWAESRIIFVDRLDAGRWYPIEVIQSMWSDSLLPPLADS